MSKDNTDACKSMFSSLSKIHQTHVNVECPICGEKSLFRHYMIMSGPYGGFVACHCCNYRKGTYQFLGEQIFKVEPMPKGVKDLYDKEIK